MHSHERVSQRAGPGRLGDAGAAGHAADDPCGGVAVQLPPVGREEDRALAAFADGQAGEDGGRVRVLRVTTGPRPRAVS